MFDYLVKPILLYASETWEPFLNLDHEKWDYQDIEKVHLQLLKQILGVNRSTTNVLVRGETNRHSLQLDILKRNIRYACYIKNKEDTSLVKQAYNYELGRKHPITFFNTIKKHEEELQNAHGQFLPYLYPHENITDITEEKLKIFTRQVHENIWKTKLEASKKAETYRTFKNQIRFEPLLSLLDRKHRRVMMKFRMSDHKLMIEEGRHYRPQIPRENRFCKICRDVVEDEQHMLTNCKLYGQRNTWFSEIGRKIPNFINLDNHQKFIFLMTQEDNQLTNETARKISDWLNLRDKIISYFF